MTRREAVLQTLAHRETVPVPYHLEFTQQALQKLVEYTGDPAIESGMGGYLHYGQYWGWPTELPEKPGYFRDEFGVVWNRTGADKDIGVIDEPLIADLADCDYRFPEPDIARLRGDIEALLRTRQDRFTFFGFGFCMFERAWSLMGMENTLANMILYPEELEKLLDGICDYMLRLVDVALEYDIDAVYFGDDWGQQRGLIMGYSHWQRFILPRMARLYRRVKQAGRLVIQHSCGDIHECFPDLIASGLDCYQTFQPEVYDIRKIKEQYGDRLSFWGGISTQRALPAMDRVQLRREIARILREMKPGGGYILAPTHAVPFDVPPENILTMLEAFRDQAALLQAFPAAAE